MLELRLLGGFDLRNDGQETKLSRKARALLAYLAVNPGQAFEREQIADLLWTRSGAEQARHSLRQTLVELRRAFAAEGTEPIRANVSTISLVPEQVQVDAIRLRILSESQHTQDWSAADQLFAGPFLDRFPPVSPGFDDWLALERGGWNELILETLARLDDQHAAGMEPAARVALCTRILAIDPIREDNHRRLMQAYADAGRRADAVRQYQVCVETLRRELDVAPSAETEALYRRLRVGSPDRLDQRVTPGFAAPAPAPVHPAERDGPPWVAVLPFRTIGPSGPPEYFAEGLVEDIVSVLSAAREPVVISTNSTRGLHDTGMGLAEIGQRLTVRYIVTGSVRIAGRRLRQAVELANAASGEVLWRRSYESAEAQMFEDQFDIAVNIARTLVPRINDNELRRVGRRPGEISAYHDMLHARDLIFRLKRESFEDAGCILRRAMMRDPNYAPLHATLADWYSLRIWQGWSPDAEGDTAALERVARSAINLDPANARALAILGHNRTILERDYNEALRLFECALAAVPNDAESLMWSSPTFAYVGQAQEAIRRAERAMALSPHDPFLFRYQHFLSIGFYAARDFEAAVFWGQQSLQGNPHYTSNLRFTIAALVALGRNDEARELSRQVIIVQPDFRVAPLIARQPFQDDSERERYGQYLIDAGLPP